MGTTVESRLDDDDDDAAFNRGVDGRWTLVSSTAEESSPRAGDLGHSRTSTGSCHWVAHLGLKCIGGDEGLVQYFRTGHKPSAAADDAASKPTGQR